MTLPWGTPASVENVLLFELLFFTKMLLWERKEFTHFIRGLCSTICSSLFWSPSLHTASNAFSISRQTNLNISDHWNASVTCWVSLSKLSVVQRFLLYALCFSPKTSLLSQCARTKFFYCCFTTFCKAIGKPDCSVNFSIFFVFVWLW